MGRIRAATLAFACAACSSGTALTSGSSTTETTATETTETTETTTAVPTTTETPTTVADATLRGERYCEILLLRPIDGTPSAEVYNTYPLNDCPDDAWKALDPAAVAEAARVPLAVANGPRFWLMDSIEPPAGPPPAPVSFGGIEMILRATVDLGSVGAGEPPYTPHHVNRKTVFAFAAGSAVYELLDPDGVVYVMQSWSQQVDPLLDEAGLADLASRLQLPTGWSYRRRVLTEELNVVTTDTDAVVLQDELKNSYSMETPASSAGSTDTTGIANTWIGPPADRTALPIGTSKVSTERAAVGGLLACDAGNPNGGGAFAVGPWMDEEAGTWDATQKVSVQGEVAWPMAQYTETIDGANRVISGNGFPVGTITGTFPIAADDPAYSYDRNPNSIGESPVDLSIPVSPVVNSTPTCLPKSVIGVFKNGVVAFASLDERNRDAVAYETQDACDGHPQQSSTYHYHDVPACLRDATVGASTVVGFAADGFPIVVERDAAGDLPTNRDLDECHGRTSPIELDGEVVTVYHYSATYEFPYFVGCFRGTPAA